MVILPVAKSPARHGAAVTVNGKSGGRGQQGGLAHAQLRLQGRFCGPPGMAAGVATLGLSVAWINGPQVKFPVR